MQLFISLHKPAPRRAVFCRIAALASLLALFVSVISGESAFAQRPSRTAVYVPPNPYEHQNAPRRFGRRLESEILAVLEQGVLAGDLQNHGNTSVNLRVDFEGDIDGAFKPSEARHLEHWRAEIAAFRLAQLLGLQRVPPAVFRRIELTELPMATQLGLHAVRGAVPGAMIYWLPVLRHSGLNSPAALANWSQRLSAGAVLRREDRTRAEELSSLLVFDFLIANWDRWTEFNVMEDGYGNLVYRDNNAGFREPLPPVLYERINTALRQSQVFSRSVIDRARALTLQSLHQAMRRDSHSRHQLLGEHQLRDVLARRDALIQYVDGLVVQHGAAHVYIFP